MPRLAQKQSNEQPAGQVQKLFPFPWPAALQESTEMADIAPSASAAQPPSTNRLQIHSALACCR